MEFVKIGTIILIVVVYWKLKNIMEIIFLKVNSLDVFQMTLHIPTKNKKNISLKE